MRFAAVGDGKIKPMRFRFLVSVGPPSPKLWFQEATGLWVWAQKTTLESMMEFKITRNKQTIYEEGARGQDLLLQSTFYEPCVGTSFRNHSKILAKSIPPLSRPLRDSFTRSRRTFHLALPWTAWDNPSYRARMSLHHALVQTQARQGMQNKHANSDFLQLSLQILNMKLLYWSELHALNQWCDLSSSRTKCPALGHDWNGICSSREASDMINSHPVSSTGLLAGWGGRRTQREEDERQQQRKWWKSNTDDR